MLILQHYIKHLQSWYRESALFRVVFVYNGNEKTPQLTNCMYPIVKNFQFKVRNNLSL